MSIKFSLKPSEIEPATWRLVEQCLNQQRHRMPLRLFYTTCIDMGACFWPMLALSLFPCNEKCLTVNMASAKDSESEAPVQTMKTWGTGSTTPHILNLGPKWRWLASHPGGSICKQRGLVTLWICNWVGPRSGLGSWEIRNLCCTHRESNRHSSVVDPSDIIPLLATAGRSLFNKTNRCTNFSKFIFVKKLYMFRAILLPIIRSSLLHIRHRYM